MESIPFRGQVVSRRVDLVAGVTTDVLDFTAPNLRWRLSAIENQSLSSLIIDVTMGYDQSEDKITFCVAPGSAVSFAGCNSATIQARALTADTSIDIQIGPDYDSQFLLSVDEPAQNITAASWVDVGTNGGYPPPHMNYIALFASGNINLRVVDPGGGITFQQNGITPDNLLLNQLRVCKYDALQVQGSGGNRRIRPSWYNRR